MNTTKYAIFVTLGILLMLVLFLVVGIFSSESTAIKLEEKVVASRQIIDTELKGAESAFNLIEKSIDSATEHYEEIMSLIAEARKEGATEGLLVKLDALTEAYPEVKTIDLYNTRIKSIESHINKIQSSREIYINDVRLYNSHVRKFPTRIFLNITGYERMVFPELELNIDSDL